MESQSKMIHKANTVGQTLSTQVTSTLWTQLPLRHSILCKYPIYEIPVWIL